MEGIIGQIILFAGNQSFPDWQPCDGRLLSIAQHQLLFSIIGTLYGGDGVQTFALPDLKTKSPLSPGHGQYLICVTGTYPSPV